MNGHNHVVGLLNYGQGFQKKKNPWPRLHRKNQQFYLKKEEEERNKELKLKQNKNTLKNK